MNANGLAAIGFLMLGACSTTEQAATARHSKWMGRSSDEFFTRYGPPASEPKLASGATIYTWTGWTRPPLSYARRGFADTTVDGLTGTAMIIGGGDVQLSCTLKIKASGKYRAIRSIKIEHDTGGCGQFLS